MTRWRKRVSESGMEKLLEETISTGLDIGAIKKSSINKLNVDTTVQEKAVSFPTDAKLYHRMREKLVALSKEHGVELRQSYKYKSKVFVLYEKPLCELSSDEASRKRA